MIEFLDKGCLSKLLYKQMLLRHKPVYSSRQALQWVGDIARALAQLHGMDPMVLHRDVKKENVMLVSNGERLVAKLVDFGLAKVRRRLRGLDLGSALKLRDWISLCGFAASSPTLGLHGWLVVQLQPQ